MGWVLKECTNLLIVVNSVEYHFGTTFVCQEDGVVCICPWIAERLLLSDSQGFPLSSSPLLPSCLPSSAIPAGSDLTVSSTPVRTSNMGKTFGATVYFRTFRRDEYTALSSPPAAQVENHLLWGRGLWVFCLMEL